MWWPIRNQILLPFALILLGAVTMTAVSAAVMAARSSERNTIAQLQQVIDTLGHSNFPYSQNVLQKMRGLSGAEFVVFDANSQPIASTIDEEIAAGKAFNSMPTDDPAATLLGYPAVRVGENSYFVSSVRQVGPSGRATMLMVLYPESRWKQARWEAAVPPLLVGAATVLVTVLVSVWLANRFSTRLHTVQQQVSDIADGNFVEMNLGRRHDEIQELASSVNRMSAQLLQMQETLRQSERSRLLGQLAGGLAHQLRNAVTGARMAIQIHLRRCPADSNDEALDVALRQLSLTEEQVKGLLSVGKHERRIPVPCELGTLVDDVLALVGPACRHADVSMAHQITGNDRHRLADSEMMRTAVLNLTLNAIEAAGNGGSVGIVVTEDGKLITFDVWDSGPGPPAELSDELFDLFVTTKPEGTGFGLALAKQAADEHGGTLFWRRENDRTHFVLEIPSSQKSRVESTKHSGETVAQIETQTTP